MDPLLPTDGCAPIRQPTPELVLVEWMAAISSFHHHYHQLAKYVDAHRIQQQLPSNSIRCVGQCPVEQLTAVLVNMEKELNKLISDIDRTDRPVAKWNGKKLTAHTRLLNRLNRQAQVVFQLASQSAS